MKKLVSSLLHVIKRYAVSYWLLIIVFFCLGTYLVFPSPLDPISSVLWPVGAGQGARIFYVASGATAYPGIVSLNIKVTNNDHIVHDYAILALIGSLSYGVWYGPGYYEDGLPPATDVQNAINSWYAQALVSTGPVSPRQSFQIVRRIEIVNDSRIKDVLVEAFDVQNASKLLAGYLGRI